MRWQNERISCEPCGTTANVPSPNHKKSYANSRTTLETQKNENENTRHLTEENLRAAKFSESTLQSKTRSNENGGKQVQGGRGNRPFRDQSCPATVAKCNDFPKVKINVNKFCNQFSVFPADVRYESAIQKRKKGEAPRTRPARSSSRAQQVGG